MRSIFVSAALVALLATSTLAEEQRNHANDYIRGGTWLYHEDDGPCGRDPLRLNCSFAPTPVANSTSLNIPWAAESVTLTVSSQVIKHLDPLDVNIQLNGVNGTDQDWVGAYCIDNPQSQVPLADKEYIDYQYTTAAVDGVLHFGPLVNMRCTWQFRYFTMRNGNWYYKLGESPYVTFEKGPQEPLHVHVASTSNSLEMKIMWVSASVPKPQVEFGLSADKLTHRITGTGETYAASDMCQSPATQVAANLYRNPGMMYSATIGPLMPGLTYYYRVSGGDSTPKSQVFKLKTPPSPGAHNEPASFIVYGDLGDWNIHATGKLPDDRTATTMQLVRRDLNDPNRNYAAVMHYGDLSYAMGKTYLWDQFGAVIQPVASEIPYMVGVGNHEYCYTTGGEKDPSGAGGGGFHPPEGNYGTDSQGECGVPTHKRFKMPNNGNNVFWWSVEMGLVHHTMVSSEHDYTVGSTMYKWIEKDLRSVNRAKTPWVFMHIHRPMYTSEQYESDHRVALLIRKHLEPLLAKYKVDIVFSGHYHAYELTCPVYLDSCRSEKLPNGLEKAKAPVHIMVGSAGADVDNVGYYDVPWRVDAILDYGYGRIHVYNETHAQFEFVLNRHGNVASSAWIISDHDWTV